MSSSTQSGTPGAGVGGYRPPRRLPILVIAIVAVVIVSSLVTGFAVYYLATPPAAGPVPVQVIGPWAGSEWSKFKPVLDKFKTVTGIPYQYTTSRQEDLTPTLPISFQAQQSPADVIFMPSATIKQYATRGWVTELTTTLSPSSYQPGALDPLTVSGKIWGGAYTGKVKPGFWYNVSYFNANGFQAPTTWAGFVSLLWALKNKTGQAPILAGDGVGWPLSDVTEHFIATYGGAAMHQALAQRTLAWTDAKVQAVFQNYLVPTLQNGFWTQPLTWNDPAVLASWWGGTTPPTHPLYFMGSWITGMVPNPNDLGVFSLPGGASTQGIVFAADYFFVPKYGLHQDLGKRLAAFLGSEAAQEEQVKQGGHIATAAGVPASAYPTVDARVAGLLQGKVVLSDLDDTIGNPFQGKFWSELQKLWATPAQWQTILAEIQAAAVAQP